MAEMMYSADRRRTCFAVMDGGHIREMESLTAGGVGLLRPYSTQNNLLTHGVILFPSEIVPLRSRGEIVASIRAFIHRYADLSESFEEVAAHYVLLSWVHDAFSELPYLRLKGDFGSGKSRCLLTIGSICYKPMFVSGASTVSPMFRIIDAFRGTLILDESDFRFSDEKAEIIKILNNGNALGFPVLRSDVTPGREFNPRAFAVFGPKILASRLMFDDVALESRCITEVMSGLAPRADIPLSLPPRFHEEAQELRNQLLRFRLECFPKYRNRPLPMVNGVEARIGQVFAPLLAMTESDEERQRLLRLAHGQAQVVKAEREASTEAQILDIMSSMRREKKAWTVKGIAEEYASRLRTILIGPSHRAGLERS